MPCLLSRSPYARQHILPRHRYSAWVPPKLLEESPGRFHHAPTTRADALLVIVLSRIVGRVARPHAIVGVIEEPGLSVHRAMQRLVRFERPDLDALVQELQEPLILRRTRGQGDLREVH